MTGGMHMQACFRIGVALVAIGLPLSAQAQTPPPPRQPTIDEKFAMANTSRSGCLTYREARAAHLAGLVRQFEAIDLAHVGCITLPEIKAYRRGTRNLD